MPVLGQVLHVLLVQLLKAVVSARTVFWLIGIGPVTLHDVLCVVEKGWDVKCLLFECLAVNVGQFVKGLIVRFDIDFFLDVGRYLGSLQVFDVAASERVDDNSVILGLEQVVQLILLLYDHLLLNDQYAHCRLLVKLGENHAYVYLDSPVHPH